MAIKTNIQIVSNLIASKVPIQLLIKISKQKTIMPFYHSVSDNYLPHIAQLYKPKSSKEFENDLDFLLKYYQPSDLNSIYKQEKFSKPRFLLSFDDGLKEVKTIIAPILKRKGIPAIVFINSDFVDNKNLFFRYKVSLIIDYLQHNKITESAKQEINIILNQHNYRNNINVEILKLKYHQQNIIKKLADILKIDFKEFLQKHKPYLSSSDLVELQKNDFSIGAHSIDHPEYRYLNIDEQLRQTKDSLLFVKENFNQNISSFSFPFTDYNVKKLFFDELNKLKICDISFGCAGLKHDSTSFHFQRIAMENENYSGEQIIKFEYLYYIFKILSRRNKIIRK